MIPSCLRPEPFYFDARIRKRGQAWITANPGSTKYEDYWTECSGDLAEAFDELCAYSVEFCPESGASVDHFLPKRDHPDQVYEWGNYRHSAYKINSRKWKNPTLDPFAIGPGWFAIRLLDLHAEVTQECPPERLKQANEFLDQLELRCGKSAIGQRQRWLKRHFTKFHPDLTFLRQMAPLLASALASASPERIREMLLQYQNPQP